MVQAGGTEILWERDGHAFIWLGTGDPEVEKGVPSHQYLVRDGSTAVLLDPGGYHAFERVLQNVERHAPRETIEELYLFLSHQDPDVCTSLISWLEVRPDAKVVVSALWERFLLHLAVPVVPDTVALADAGGQIQLPSGAPLEIIPAHYLHSPGNFTVYDPTSRILFSGDIGAALVPPDRWALFVEDFDEHARRMLGFHQRYMSSNKALRRWVLRVQGLKVDLVCPQHGSILRGDDVARFFDWLARLDVGVDCG